MTRLLVLTLLVLSVAAVPQTGGPGGNSVCAQWCAANFANPGNICTAPAAHGGGPCYICGPLKTSLTEQLCRGACSETSSDPKNCGACGNVCPAGSTCNSGACVCTNSGKPLCNGGCPDLTSDNNNCGRCGNVCPPASTCTSGSCVRPYNLVFGPEDGCAYIPTDFIDQTSFFVSGTTHAERVALCAQFCDSLANCVSFGMNFFPSCQFNSEYVYCIASPNPYAGQTECGIGTGYNGCSIYQDGTIYNLAT